MLEKINILGAITAITFFVSAILLFTFRLLGKPQYGHWIGYFESVFGLYVLKKLDYGPEQVGGILTLVGAIALTGRGLLTGFVTSHWGEPTVIKTSPIVGAVGFTLLLLANTY